MDWMNDDGDWVAMNELKKDRSLLGLLDNRPRYSLNYGYLFVFFGNQSYD